MKQINRFEIRLRYQSFHSEAFEILKKKLMKLSNEVFSFSSIRLPLQKKRITLLKSPHVNKKARDQIEIRLYNGLISIQGDKLSLSFLESIKSLSIPDTSLKFSINLLKKDLKGVVS